MPHSLRFISSNVALIISSLKFEDWSTFLLQAIKRNRLKYRLSGVSETRNKRQCLFFFIPYDLTTYYYAVNMFLMLILVKVAYIMLKLYHITPETWICRFSLWSKTLWMLVPFFLHLTSEYDKTIFCSSYWLLRIAKSWELSHYILNSILQSQ